MLQWIKKTKEGRKIKAAIWPLFLASAVFIFALFFFRTIAPAAAQGLAPGADLGLTSQVQQNIGLASTDIRVIIAQIIRVALGFLGLIFLVLTLYAGFLWMTSGGNEQKISDAKGLLVNGVIGLAIILSAYGITLFVMRLLGLDQSQFAGQTTTGVAGNEANFYGSGSLGTVIKDHYPSRDQIDVPRNTKIIITFRQPVTTTSFIDDTNGDGILGNCVNLGDPNFNWKNNCDKLKVGNDLIKITRSDTGDPISGANVLVSYENGKAYSVVIRPFDYLGSDSAKVPYTVRIGKGVLIDDPANSNPSVFEGFPTGRDFYTWNFTCSNKLDITPPHVKDVFPGKNATESKNSAIQITFDKAMDPSTLQGSFSVGSGADANAYILKGNSVFQKISNSTVPLGIFRLVNNYQTLEFVSSQVCGQNACGGRVYCLPVCDAPGANCSSDNYEILLRAGKTFSNTSFEALPLSGVTDASGNALDGNNNGHVDAASSTGAVFPNQETPDNYFWTFTLSNQLDLTAPYIQKTIPGPDATFVAPADEWGMLFSKRMLIDSLYHIDLDEKPISPDPVCRSPRVTNNPDGTSYVKMSHCPFSSSDVRHYYFPVVDSNVQDVHYNCLYPGNGPNKLDINSNSSVICDSANPTNCCAVTSNPANAFCCNGLTNFADRQSCLANLKL